MLKSNTMKTMKKTKAKPMYKKGGKPKKKDDGKKSSKEMYDAATPRKQKFSGTTKVDGESYKVTGTTRTRKTVGGGEKIVTKTKGVKGDIGSPVGKRRSVIKTDKDGKVVKEKSKVKDKPVSSRSAALRKQFADEDKAKKGGYVKRKTMKKGGVSKKK
jgi:hypothetical protein